MSGTEISASLDIIENVIGTRWFHDQVHLIRGADPRHGIGGAPGYNEIHPLGLAWFNAREEVILSEITGTDTFSPNTLRVVRLGKELSLVSVMEGFTAQKNRLLGQSLFRVASYEISIAAGYARWGCRLEFTPSGFEIIPTGCRITVDCFLMSGAAEDAGAGLEEIFEKGLKKGEGCTGPAIAYFEPTEEGFKCLRADFKQTTGRLHGKAYNAVVITCPAAPGRPRQEKNQGAGFTIVNPAPRFSLPAGFKLYSPPCSSSMS